MTDDDDDEGEVKAAADLNKAGLGKAKTTVEQQPELSMADASLASSLMSKEDHRKYAEMLRHTETAKELTTGLTTNAFVFFFFFGGNDEWMHYGLKVSDPKILNFPPESPS